MNFIYKFKISKINREGYFETYSTLEKKFK